MTKWLDHPALNRLHGHDHAAKMWYSYKHDLLFVTKRNGALGTETPHNWTVA